MEQSTQTVVGRAYRFWPTPAPSPPSVDGYRRSYATLKETAS